MASPMFLHIQHLNRLRDVYARPCELGDAPLNMQEYPLARAFAWERGCPGADRNATRVLIALNLDRAGGSPSVALNTSWGEGTQIVDVLSGDMRHMVDAVGRVTLTLPPHGVAMLVTSAHRAPFPPVVSAVEPAHDELVASLHGSRLRVTFYFDQDTANNGVEDVLLNGQSILPSSWCSQLGGCRRLDTYVDSKLEAGVHELTLLFLGRGPERIGGVFRSRFRVAADPSHDVVSHPHRCRNNDLVSFDLLRLKHAASGASHYRVRRADQPTHQFSQWFALGHAPSLDAFTSSPGVPTVVQYHCAGSSAYFTAGCRNIDRSPCPVSFYASMHLRACTNCTTAATCNDLDTWGEASAMSLTYDYTWSADFEVGSAPVEVWLDPFGNGESRFGSAMKMSVQRAMQDAGQWVNTSQESIASSASWAQAIRVDACCSFQAERKGVIAGQLVDDGWHSLNACTVRFNRCRMTFNDLTFAITVSQATPPPPPPPPESPPPPAAPMPQPLLTPLAVSAMPPLRAAGPQSAAAVELFEWPYESIEKECPRLGLQGWAAVIISPPAAHVTLTPAAVAAMGMEGSFSS